jgi:hypothetical protein
MSESPRPLAGMLPYGDRTFLPANGAAARPAVLNFIISPGLAGGKLNNKKHLGALVDLRVIESWLATSARESMVAGTVGTVGAVDTRAKTS